MQTTLCHSSAPFRMPSRDSSARLADRPLIYEKCFTLRFSRISRGAYRLTAHEVETFWLWICQGLRVTLGRANLLVLRNAVVWNAQSGSDVIIKYSDAASKDVSVRAYLPSSSSLERIGIAMMLNWILNSEGKVC